MTIDPSKPLKDPRWESYAQHRVKLDAEGKALTQSAAARLAGFKPGSSRQWASKLERKPAVAARIAWLKGQAAEGVVMSRREMLERLTIIARGNVMDFMDRRADGEIIFKKLDPKDPRTAAIEALKSRIERGGEDEPDFVCSEMKLRDPLRAMEQLARAEGWEKGSKGMLLGADGAGGVRLLFVEATAEDVARYKADHVDHDGDN